MVTLNQDKESGEPATEVNEMETTREQDIIISRMSDYKMIEAEWNKMTKDWTKPIWVGEGADEKVRDKYRYLDKYEYTLNAVLEALNVTMEDAEKLYDEWEAFCAKEC